MKLIPILTFINVVLSIEFYNFDNLNFGEVQQFSTLKAVSFFKLLFGGEISDLDSEDVRFLNNQFKPSNKPTLVVSVNKASDKIPFNANFKTGYSDFFERITIKNRDINELEFGDDISLFKSLGFSQPLNSNDVFYFNIEDESIIDDLMDLKDKFSIILINLDNKLLKRDNASCFETEEACQIGTLNCNSHGICSKMSSKCWSCICSSSFNKTTSKTTNWSGYDCSKKDVSSVANLLLWSSITIFFMFAGGVKFLMSIGDEPLPGILDLN